MSRARQERPRWPGTFRRLRCPLRAQLWHLSLPPSALYTVRGVQDVGTGKPSAGWHRRCEARALGQG
eukprot:4150554-Lingulodinium_polyedra.AAC.1